MTMCVLEYVLCKIIVLSRGQAQTPSAQGSLHPVLFVALLIKLRVTKSKRRFELGTTPMKG